MRRLADAERFEDAALTRDRLRALAEALSKRRVDAWLTRGSLVLRDHRDPDVALRDGSLDGEWPVPTPCPRDRADELSALRSWVLRRRPSVEHADTPLSEPVDGGAALHGVLRMLRAPRR